MKNRNIDEQNPIDKRNMSAANVLENVSYSNVWHDGEREEKK